MAGVDGKVIVNAVYHGAVVAALTVGTAKLTKVIFKGATLPKLDADMYDLGMMVLDTSIALALRDLLIKEGLIPADILHKPLQYQPR